MPGHKCKMKPFMLMMTEEEELYLESMLPKDGGNILETMTMDEGQVSLNAIGGLLVVAI